MKNLNQTTKVARLAKRLLISIGVFCSAFNPALADTLDDNLNTVWEVLWDQRGTPRQLQRWDIKAGPVRYRIFGDSANQQRKHLQTAIASASEISGVQFKDVSDSPSAASESQLDLEVVNQLELTSNMPCYMQAQRVQGGYFQKVLVKMREQNAYECAFHEFMHAMGLHGHPSGKTVLSYFRYRRDVFMDLDQVMLKAIYSPDMPQLATPLEALPVMAKYVAAQEYSGLSATDKQQRVDAYLKRTLSEMTAFAKGEGEVPLIVIRSGRVTQAHMDNARNEMAYYLGLAYNRGNAAVKDQALAYEWFNRGALNNHSPSQVMAGRALFYGRGVAIDTATGLNWLTKAAAAGNTVAKAELVNIGKKALERSSLEAQKPETKPVN